MKIFIGSDHAGFALKEKLKQKFSKVHEFEDVGTFSEESCHYPEFAERVARAVLADEKAASACRGVLICGTGLGVAIAANKIKGIRAASVSETFSARMAYEHNQAQILCLGARVLDEAKASECLEAFLNATFDTSNPRHAERVRMISEIENKEGLK